MDITIPKNSLSRALQITQSAVAKRTTMPILANILLSASDDELKISSSDLELSVLANAKAKVKQQGSTTVSARVFADVIRELPEGEVKICVSEGERVEVFCGTSHFKIYGKAADEYPTLPGLNTAVSGQVEAGLLVEMINKTLYASSMDETRFNLNGVCFEIVGGAGNGKGKKGAAEEKSLRMVATDGHRLAMITRPVHGFTFEGRIIVPRKGLSELRRVLELEQAKQAGLGVKDGFLICETPSFKISVRLIDGEYPDYSQVIPAEKGEVALVKGPDLIQAVRRVMLMVTDREKCVRLHFSGDKLRITSSSPEIGEASEELALKYEGDVLTLGFNALYLMDVASSLSQDGNIKLELHGELGPGKFALENDESSTAIVMPMRL